MRDLTTKICIGIILDMSTPPFVLNMSVTNLSIIGIVMYDN